MHIKYAFLYQIHNSCSESLLLNFKSSHLQMFFKIDILQKFAVLTGKYLCLSYILFNIVAELEASNFIKMRLKHRNFLVNIAKILRAPILKNISVNGCFCTSKHKVSN